LFRKGQLERDRDADIRDVRSLPDLKDESPPPSQAKSDDLRRAIVNLVEVANGLSSNSFEEAWGKVQNYLKLLRKRVEVAQINVQENGAKLRDAQTNEKLVLAKAEQQANDMATQKLNAVERLRQREEQDKMKASAKRAVAQYQRDYAKWRAELENARTDLEAAKAGTRSAQAARAAWIGEKLYGAAEQDPDGRRLRSFVSELQTIGDEHVMARLEAVAPHLEPWMRKAIAIYASWEREVSELTAEREAVGRRAVDSEAQAQQFMLMEVGLPDELKAPLLVEDVLKTQAGTVARMNFLGTPVSAVTPITSTENPAMQNSKSSPRDLTRSGTRSDGSSPLKSMFLEPDVVALNEQYLSELAEKVSARQGDMQTMRRNFSHILQHRLVHGREGGGKLSFNEAERLLAALSTKDYARAELKVLQKAVMAARPSEEARATFHVSQDHLRSMRDPLGYLRAAKAISNPLPRRPSTSQSASSPTLRLGTPASPTRPKSTPASPTTMRAASVPGRGYF
jgi:hypothetical protein